MLYIKRKILKNYYKDNIFIIVGQAAAFQEPTQFQSPFLVPSWAQFPALPVHKQEQEMLFPPQLPAAHSVPCSNRLGSLPAPLSLPSQPGTCWKGP